MPKAGGPWEQSPRAAVKGEAKARLHEASSIFLKKRCQQVKQILRCMRFNDWFGFWKVLKEGRQILKALRR